MIASAPQSDPPKLGRRIVRLFRPHRGALTLIVAMILITSALSVISALLVRRVFDDALFVRGGPDLGALYPLVAALIAIPIVNGVLKSAACRRRSPQPRRRW
jgi:ATP-binding cassette, subfamily B, bacterial